METDLDFIRGRYLVGRREEFKTRVQKPLFF